MTDREEQHTGAGGYCICPKCVGKIPHERGMPCQKTRCPLCGAKMLRVSAKSGLEISSSAVSHSALSVSPARARAAAFYIRARA